jgi:hypothetical protein
MSRNFLFLCLAITGVIFFILTGISVAERSLLGFSLSMIGAVLTIGFGFMLKKRWRDQDHN